MKTRTAASLIIALFFSVAASKDLIGNEVSESFDSGGLSARLGVRTIEGDPDIWFVMIRNIAKDGSFCFLKTGPVILPNVLGDSVEVKDGVWTWRIDVSVNAFHSSYSHMAGLYVADDFDFGGISGSGTSEARITLPKMPNQLKGKKFRVHLILSVARMPFPKDSKVPVFETTYVMTDVSDESSKSKRDRDEETSKGVMVPTAPMIHSKFKLKKN